jgi:hypothetical protein
VAAPVCVLTIIKRFNYRGNANEEWGNTYMLTGTTPVDGPAWKSLFDSIVAQEKTVYTASSVVIRGYGYDRVPVKGDHAIYSVDLRPSSTTVPGTLATATGERFPGDGAAWVRWSLNRFNSYGKRVYLRKYFHDGLRATGGTDGLLAAYITALNGFGTFMMGGTVGGTRNLCDPLGNVPIASAASSFITTRTLKRRSKKKATP